MASDDTKNVGVSLPTTGSNVWKAYADHMNRAQGMVPKVNNNGGALVTGDVVVSDSALANAVKQTTTQGDLRPVYVVPYELGTDNSQSARSYTDGETNFYFGAGTKEVTVNCDTAAVALDEYLITSSTAKKATASGTTAAAGQVPPPGAFAIAREAKGSGASAIQAEMLGSVEPGGDAASLTFTPTTAGDWLTGADPGDVQEALDQVAQRAILTSTTETSINDSTDETTVFTATLPGGTLGTNRLILMRIPYTYNNTSGANRYAQFKIKYGATTIVTTAAQNYLSFNGTGQGIMEVALWGDGSTSAQEAVASSAASYNLGGTALSTGGQGTAAETSTGDLTLAVTVTMSAASASLTFVVKGCTVLGPFTP